MPEPKKSVSPEDQIQINKFARLHKNNMELKVWLKWMDIFFINVCF
jgi:hypothetical protein